MAAGHQACTRGFAGAEQVADAAAADGRVRRVRADVGTPVPAAVALGVGAGQRLHRQRVAAPQRDGRSDEDELQVVAQAGQQRVVFRPAR